jgi:hypothetical protein
MGTARPEPGDDVHPRRSPLRELCRRHGIRSHSVVVDQAQKHDWAAKRETYRAKDSESFIVRYADRMADRQAEFSHKALDAIDEALDKFRSDGRATEKKFVNGEWVEVPAIRLKPNEVAILSRHQALVRLTGWSGVRRKRFAKPARPQRSQRRSFVVGQPCDPTWVSSSDCHEEGPHW